MKTTEKSIRSVLNDIKANQFILPALQREFVWKRRDIENLFDSLLQGFPINTMMFWTVNDIKKESMEFYQFLDPDFKESQSLNKLYPVRDNELMVSSVLPVCMWPYMVHIPWRKERIKCIYTFLWIKNYLQMNWRMLH